jgi:hypothetical protein
MYRPLLLFVVLNAAVIHATKQISFLLNMRRLHSHAAKHGKSVSKYGKIGRMMMYRHARKLVKNGKLSGTMMNKIHSHANVFSEVSQFGKASCVTWRGQLIC